MAQATLSCPFGAIHLEMRKGLLPVSTLPEAVLTVIAPWTPSYGERPPEGWEVLYGGQNQDRPVLLAPGAQAPTTWKFGSICVVRIPPTLA